MKADEYKSLRKKLGLNQAGLAALLGVTRKTVNRREAGDATITVEAALSLRWLVKAKRITSHE